MNNSVLRGELFIEKRTGLIWQVIQVLTHSSSLVDIGSTHFRLSCVSDPNVDSPIWVMSHVFKTHYKPYSKALAVLWWED